METKARGVHWQQCGFLWVICQHTSGFKQTNIIKTDNLSILNCDVIMHKQHASAKQVQNIIIYIYIHTYTYTYTYIHPKKTCPCEVADHKWNPGTYPLMWGSDPRIKGCNQETKPNALAWRWTHTWQQIFHDPILFILNTPLLWSQFPNWKLPTYTKPWFQGVEY